MTIKKCRDKLQWVTQFSFLVGEYELFATAYDSENL